MDRAPSPGITAKRRADRTADELVGICRGLLADGHVNFDEWRFLADWIQRNAEFVKMAPYDVLFARIVDALQDGVVDQDEQQDLLGALAQFVGGEICSPAAQSVSLSTTLPLDDPAPMIEHLGSHFVITGTFRVGARRHVEEVITNKGGIVLAAVSSKVRYLLVGEIASRDWVHSNSGRKIERAIELRGLGHEIAIVGEQCWVASISG